MQQLRRLWSIALTEWKLQIRSAVFWASLAILLVYALAPTIARSSEMRFLPRVWLESRDNSLTWLSIALIFLAPSALARDRRTGAFIWTTPVTGYTYAAGKLLGIWLVALTLAWIELTVQAVVLVQVWEYLTPEAVSMILASLGRWIVGILYITSLFFLLTVIVRGRLHVAYACCCAYFVAVFSVRDIANPLCIFPIPVFRSDLVWDGPESILFNANRTLYLGLAAVTSTLALLIYPRCEQRSVSNKAMRVVLMVGVMISLGATGWAGHGLLDARSRILASERLRLDTPFVLADEEVESVGVVARFMPMQGFMQGDVQLFLTGPGPNLDFHVPAGLEFTAITDCQGRALSIERRNSAWMRVINPPSQVCVAFEGAWLVDRRRYRQREIANPGELILNTDAYLAHGYLYLTPGARWYPAPVGPYESRAIYDIEVILPRDSSVRVSPKGSVESADREVTYRWQNVRGKPFIMLAVGEYREVALSSNDVVLVAPGRERSAAQTAAFYLETLRPIEKLVGSHHAVYTIVETPLLRWPIASTGLILIPESYFTEQLIKSLAPTYSTRHEIAVSIHGNHHAWRYEAYHIARGWLQGQANFAILSSEDVFASFGVDIVPVDPLNLLSDYVPLRECIAHYLAAQVVDQKLGTNVLEEIIDERIQHADRYLADPIGRGSGVPLSSVTAFSYETSWYFNQLFASFGRLERRVGREQVNFMIEQLLASHAGSTITLQDWLETIELLAGTAARQEFATTIQRINE